MKNSTPSLTACWLTRLFALLVCLLWGAFFVKHLQEWFLGGSGALPPFKVWIGQLLHLVMILGLAMIIWWPSRGTVVTIVGTVFFFSWIGMKEFPYIALLNLLPIAFVLVSWALRRKGQGAEQGTGDESLTRRKSKIDL